MNWNQLYGLRTYLRSSLWFVPFIAILFDLVATRLVHWIDPWLGWKLMGFTVPGAQALFQAVVTATLRSWSSHLLRCLSRFKLPVRK